MLREHLTDLLDRAVRARLMSDVPLGAPLSGGIDSSLVVAFMRRHAGGQVDTYSAGFSDESLDESPHARLAAEYLGTRHHEIRVDDCTPELLEHLVWHLDEPVADLSHRADVRRLPARS